MALGAGVAGVVVPAFDLRVRGRARGIGLVTPDAMAVGEYFHLHVRIVHMCLACTVTTLAGEGLVLVLIQHFVLIEVTFFAGHLPGKISRVTRRFVQRFSTVETVLSKRGRHEKVTGDKITPHDADYHQDNPNNLRRYLG